MSARAMRRAPVQGVKGEMLTKGLARAFTSEYFYQLPLQTATDSMVLHDQRGRQQVIFKDGMWIVCGKSWGQFTPPRRIIHWAARVLTSSGICLETAIDEVVAAIHCAFRIQAEEHEPAAIRATPHVRRRRKHFFRRRRRPFVA